MDEISMTVRLPGRPVPLYQDTYNLAQGFYLAGTRCALNIEVGPGLTQSLVAPAVVNYCFAVELFLKALVQAEGSTPPKTHDLEQLFAAISAKDREGIRSRYEQTVQAPSLEEQLSKIGNYFTRVRYGYEHEDFFSFDEALIHLIARACYMQASRLGGEGPAPSGIRI